MDHNDIERQGFTGRIALLEKVVRFSNRKHLFYRSNLRMHTLRVHWMEQDLRPHTQSILPDLNFNFIENYALVHDDLEFITGDITADVKESHSRDEKERLHKMELQALKLLKKRWPTYLNGFEYASLLEAAIVKKLPETQYISYIDKFDAVCESIHELCAGNILFYNEFPDNRPPIRGTVLKKLRTEYTLLGSLFASNHQLFALPVTPEVTSLLENGSPHTPELIRKPTGIRQYDHWKATVLKHGGEEGLCWLTQRREQYINT